MSSDSSATLSREPNGQSHERPYGQILCKSPLRFFTLSILTEIRIRQLVLLFQYEPRNL